MSVQMLTATNKLWLMCRVLMVLNVQMWFIGRGLPFHPGWRREDRFMNFNSASWPNMRVSRASQLAAS